MDIERLRYLLGTVLVRGMSGEYSEIITAFTALKQENTLWGTEVERLCAEVERLKDNLAYHRKRADYEKERTDKAEAALERIVGPIRGIDKDSSWWDGSTENYGKHLKSMHAAFDHIEQEKPPEEQERDRLKDTDQYREGMKDYEAFWSSRWQDWRTRAKAAEANCNTYLGDFQKLEGELSAEMERATVAEAALERVVGPIRELRNLWKSTPLHNYHAFGRETPEDHGPPELGWYESILSNRELRYKIAPVIRDHIEQEKLKYDPVPDKTLILSSEGLVTDATAQADYLIRYNELLHGMVNDNGEKLLQAEAALEDIVGPIRTDKHRTVKGPFKFHGYSTEAVKDSLLAICNYIEQEKSPGTFIPAHPCDIPECETCNPSGKGTFGPHKKSPEEQEKVTEMKADPEVMKSIRHGLADREAGRVKPWSQVAQEVGCPTCKRPPEKSPLYIAGGHCINRGNYEQLLKEMSRCMVENCQACVDDRDQALAAFDEKDKRIAELEQERDRLNSRCPACDNCDLPALLEMHEAEAKRLYGMVDYQRKHAVDLTREIHEYKARAEAAEAKVRDFEHDAFYSIAQSLNGENGKLKAEVERLKKNHREIHLLNADVFQGNLAIAISRAEKVEAAFTESLQVLERIVGPVRDRDIILLRDYAGALEKSEWGSSAYNKRIAATIYAICDHIEAERPTVEKQETPWPESLRAPVCVDELQEEKDRSKEE